MGNIQIVRPDWFTKEKYLEYKSQGMKDRDIYENILFVSLKTFSRFKRELGVYGIGNRGGHNKKIDYKKAKKMYQKGFSTSAIAARYGSTRDSAYRAVHTK